LTLFFFDYIFWGCLLFSSIFFLISFSVSHYLGGRFVRIAQVFFFVALILFYFVLQNSIHFKIKLLFFFFCLLLDYHIRIILLAGFDVTWFFWCILSAWSCSWVLTTSLDFVSVSLTFWFLELTIIIFSVLFL
jgi:hypothetical protein